jgi:hypothetical protein
MRSPMMAVMRWPDAVSQPPAEQDKNKNKMTRGSQSAHESQKNQRWMIAPCMVSQWLAAFSQLACKYGGAKCS